MPLASPRFALCIAITLLPGANSRMGETRSATDTPAVLRASDGSRALPLQGADSILGVFEGRTPCGSIASGFTGFGGPGCEKIKWRLTLYRDPATRNATTYGYAGTRSTRQGDWVIDSEAAGARIFRLYDDRRRLVLSLLSIDDKVLLLLDAESNVLVGDASWSYVLNRVNPPRR